MVFVATTMMDLRLWISMMWLKIFLVTLSFSFTHLALAKENADQIVPQSSTMTRLAERIKKITDSRAAVVEILPLGQGDNKTIGIFEAPDSGPQQGAVVVLLGAGQILEQSEYSISVRQVLAASGWASLIVQTELMDKRPVAPTSTDLSNGFLKAATEQLSAKGYSNLVIVAHGSVAQDIWPTVQSSESGFLGFVGIDEWFVDDFSPSIPVLNVVNRRLPKAMNYATKRFSLMKKSPSAPCELFFYEGTLGSDVGYGEILSNRIRGWIERHFNNAS